MKDLEKIKSEDLGCQVADANPGNFAIEQEVAQLVGATVPQPTEPSADDARELGAQLLVFLRRALTPIQSALRTALAAIYAHLDSRCTDYTPAAYDPLRAPFGPYDPMRPFVPRTLPNLLTALTAFSARKISNGSAPNDGIPDGVSLMHIFNDATSVLKLEDENKGWTMTKNPLATFTAAKTFKSCCKAISMNMGLNQSIFSNAVVEELQMDELETISDTGQYGGYNTIFSFSNLVSASLAKLRTVSGCLFGGKMQEELTLPELTTARAIAVGVSGLKRLIAPKFTTSTQYTYHPNLLANNPDLEYAYIPNIVNYTVYGADTGAGSMQNMPKLEELHIGKVVFTSNASYRTCALDGCGSLIKLVIYGDLNQNLYLNSWNPTDKGTTFLQNFKEHIALRLSDNGSGKTLTLHRDVVDAIDAAEATYGIRHIICNQKGWTISPAPTA